MNSFESKNALDENNQELVPQVSDNQPLETTNNTVAEPTETVEDTQPSEVLVENTQAAPEAKNVESSELTPDKQVEKEEKNYFLRSREELLEDMRELMIEPAIETIKSSVELIKHAFYKKQNTDTSEESDVLEQEIEHTESIIDKVEVEFKELLSKYKLLKAEANAKLEEIKEQNLVKKQAVLSKLEELINSTDDLSSTIPAFRKLQQEWKKIEQVPQKSINEIWKTYNRYQEKFYDLIKINNDLREYDFRKNLELKTSICESAEKLEDEQNPVLAFNDLQKLHEEWRAIGPVAKDDREMIWNRFKEASSKINKKHQAYYESIKAKEEENLGLKSAICEKIEAIDFSKFKNISHWEKASDEILKLQQDWKQIGFATRKHNTKIFKRFRTANDSFFKAKNTYFRTIKDDMQANLNKRKDILAKAEEFKDSTDWEEASKIFVDLQKEWKKIGITPRKYSKELWDKFSSICDNFFDQKKQAVNSGTPEERENLEKKKQIIEKIKDYVPSGVIKDDVEQVKQMVSEYIKVGFVPIKEKRSLKELFDKTTDAKFDQIYGDKREQRSSKPVSKASSKLNSEYENLKKEITAYENNIMFLSSSSKKGNSIVEEMNKKVEALKEKLSELSEKIEGQE